MDSDSDIIDVIVRDGKENIEDLRSFYCVKNELAFSTIKTTGDTDYALTVGINPDYKTHKKIMNDIFIVVFPSSRVEVCYIENTNMNDLYDELNKGDYIVIEADRGYDCAQIMNIKKDYDYKKLLKIDINTSMIDCQSILDNDISPRKILRRALDSDIEMMFEKQIKERLAFEKCSKKVENDKYPMKLLCAEYQWDMQKLTFFFSSPQTVDFRELVQELYKLFKVRIWMCSIEKSKNRILKQLLL
ncbi:hypothetical protein CDIK_2521 [Cucumispora dikerogammari]|nr:hypothetical protein CDIK_2521 [Cucumispora dikerogammari]